MVFYLKPYSTNRNIGEAYNESMSLLKSDDHWGCLMDGDTAFLNFDYGHKIESIIQRYPDAGMFTCYTNRVGNPQQCWEGHISDIDSMKYHHRLAEKIWQKNKTNCTRLHHSISGMLMIIKKSIWNKIHFRHENNMILKVDNYFSRELLRSNIPIYRMDGIYILHYYRMNEGINNKNHLK